MELAEQLGCLTAEGPQMPRQGPQVLSQEGGILRGNAAARFAFLGEGESAHGPGAGGGCEDQARTPAAAGGAMVGSSTWRGFRTEAAGRREAKGVCLPAFRPRCREKHVAGFHLFFIFLSAAEFILRTCPHCSDLSRRAVFQHKDNS